MTTVQGTIPATTIIAPPWTASGSLPEAITGEALIEGGCTPITWNPELPQYDDFTPVVKQAEPERSSDPALIEGPSGGRISRIYSLFRSRPPLDTGKKDDKDKDDPNYKRNRTLDEHSMFVWHTTGRTIEAWIAGGMIEASLAGESNFHVAVLGPGRGFAEKELAKKIAPLCLQLGMRLYIDTYSLPDDDMDAASISSIERMSNSGITLKRRFMDFDKEEIEGPVDILYAVKSTIHTRDNDAITQNIHNALRPPTETRPGGEAFFMLHTDWKDLFYKKYGNFIARGLRLHAKDACDDADQMNTYMIRESSGLVNIRAVIRAVEKEKRLPLFELTRGKILEDGSEFWPIWLRAAQLIFSANGIPLNALSEKAIRSAFSNTRYILGYSSLPLYEQAWVVFGNNAIDLIRAYGNKYDRYNEIVPQGSLFDRWHAMRPWSI